MQKLVFTIFILLQCFLGRSQLYVQSGAGFKTTGDVQITLDGAGVTNNDASADFSNAILNFKGANSVSINGTGTWAIKKIILDNQPVN